MASIALTYNLDGVDLQVYRDFNLNETYLNLAELLELLGTPPEFFKEYALIQELDLGEEERIPLLTVASFLRHCAKHPLYSSRALAIFNGRAIRNEIDELYKRAGYLEVKRVLHQFSDTLFYRAYIDVYADTYLEINEAYRLIEQTPSATDMFKERNPPYYTGYIYSEPKESPEVVPELWPIQRCIGLWLYYVYLGNHRAIDLLTICASTGLDMAIFKRFLRDQAQARI